MKIQRMKALYNKAKRAKIKEIINCPSCGQLHLKSTYNKVFCTNARISSSNCKDNFWNKVDPEKRCRNTTFFRDVICKDSDLIDEGPEGWDGHK